MGIVMERNLSEEERYIEAKKKVENIKGFYGNLVSYVLVNAILIFIRGEYKPSRR